LECEPAGHYVIGDVSDQAILTEGIRPQANERFGDANAELNRDNARRIMHNRVKIRTHFEVLSHRTRQGASLSAYDLLGNHLSHHQGIGVLVVS
jgi:hypothetical protein